MKWSILIPTLNEPESIRHLQSLRRILDPQVEKFPGQVELRFHDAPRSMPTGTKRNQLIANSDGEYFSQIDVDDKPPPYYVEEIMNGIAHNPDVISFVGFMTTDSINKRDFVIKLGERYEERNGVYYRHPNHLTCLKRSVVEHIKFRPIWVQEDYFYAVELKKQNVLKTEYHISNKWMYHYDFKTQKVPNYYRPYLR